MSKFTKGTVADSDIFTLAFMHSGVGKALVSPDGRLLDVNNALCHMLGFSKEELLARGVQDVTYADDLNADLDLMQQMLDRKIDSYSLEKRYVSKSKKIVWALLTVSMAWNDNGTPGFFISQIVDITRRKELGDELTRKNGELEAARISLANKIKHMENIHSIIGHNLRGPVSNIKLLTGILRQEEGSEANMSAAQANVLEMIDEGCDALLENLEALLQLASINMNKDIKYDECNMPHIVHNIQSQLQGVIFEKSARIKCDFQIKSIAYPAAYMESILYNLISNSLKYSKPHIAPEITITTAIRHNKAVLIIKDNGLGIDTIKYGDRLFKISQTFHHGHDSKGLGLFIIKSQIESLGGSISVNSVVNEGTTFTVVF